MDEGNHHRPPGQLLAGTLILIVEDMDDLRSLLARLLERSGAEVVAASSGSEALGLFDRGLEPTLVVSDLCMPGMGGCELLTVVRRIPLAVQPPAVALTALPRHEHRGRAVLAGFDEYVEKPADGPQLVALLASLVHVAAP